MTSISTQILLYVIAFFCLILFGLWLLKRIVHFFTPFKPTPFGFKGKLLYLDKGKASQTFINKQYNIAAKGGDFIYLTEQGEHILIEYKSRKGPVYESDVAQTIASVLAARSCYPISQAMVITETQSKKINVSGNDDVLYNEIKQFHLLTQQIKQGKAVTRNYAKLYKCKSCNMQAFCKFKLS